MSNVKIFKEYSNFGMLFSKTYHIDGDPHRVGRPARIWYDNSGFKTKQEYWVNGEIHRINGPAVSRFHNRCGKLIPYDQEYWFNGEFFDMFSKLKYNSIEELEKEFKYYFKTKCIE